MKKVYLDCNAKNHNFEIEFDLPYSLSRFKDFVAIEDSYLEHVKNSVLHNFQAVYDGCSDDLQFRIKDSKELVCYRDVFPYSGFNIKANKISPINPQSPLDIELLFKYIKANLEEINTCMLDGYFKTVELVQFTDSIIILSEISFFESDKKYQCSIVIDSVGNLQINIPSFKTRKGWIECIKAFIFDRLIPQV